MKHPQEELTALLDGALPPARAGEIARHLAECPSCSAERDRLAAGLAALRALPAPPEPSPGFAAGFRARLAAEERRERGGGLLARLRGLRWKIAAPALAAGLAAAVVLVAVRLHRAEEAAVAEHLDLLLDYEVVASLGAVETAEDAAVVADLDALAGKGMP